MKLLVKTLVVVGLLGIQILLWAQDLNQKAFPHKLIYSETPEIGRKWRGGIRMSDVIVWDLYFNVGGWFLVDILNVGLNRFPIDSVEITDKFFALTLKTRPLLTPMLGGNPYKLSCGMKVYADTTRIPVPDDVPWSFGERSTVLFVTQSLQNHKNCFHLFSSMSFQQKGSWTYYLVPGYRRPLSENWSIGIEYYMTNTIKLPMRILQFAFDADNLDFYNQNRDMYSWVFWGFQYSRRHFRFDLTLAHHILFQGPIIPLIGFGWNF